MEDKRVFQIIEDGTWKFIEFQDIKEGNIFRAFEETGEPVEDEDGKTIFEALDDCCLEGSATIPRPFVAMQPYEGEINGK